MLGGAFRLASLWQLEVVDGVHSKREVDQRNLVGFVLILKQALMYPKLHPNQMELLFLLFPPSY